MVHCKLSNCTCFNGVLMAFNGESKGIFMESKRRYIVFLLFLWSSMACPAAPIKTICGEYTYVVPDNVSREDAKRIAAERARLEALTTEYGTLVSQNNTTFVSNRNGESDIVFQSLGGSDVRGEWLGDTEEPAFRFSVDERTGETSVYAHVCGKSREITRSQVPLQLHVLRNGTQPHYESETFRTNDDLYVSFLSPVDGYLTVFLLGDSKQVVCMLPYQSQSDGAYTIAANRQYVFFSQAQASLSERPLVDEYVMTCNTAQETNYLFCVFSTQPFSKPAMPNGVLSLEDFTAWRARLLRHDTHAQVSLKTILIRK